MSRLLRSVLRVWKRRRVSVCAGVLRPLSLSPPTVNVTVLLGFVIREATLS